MSASITLLCPKMQLTEIKQSSNMRQYSLFWQMQIRKNCKGICLHRIVLGRVPTIRQQWI